MPAIQFREKNFLKKFNENTIALDRGKSKRIAEKIFEFDRLKGVAELIKEMS